MFQEPAIVRIRCGACLGTGAVTFTKMCPVCGGRGWYEKPPKEQGPLMYDEELQTGRLTIYGRTP